jgi:glycerol-3-phosphate acyltransferase PlsY
MDGLLIFLLACIAAYLLGSLPVGFLIARVRGVDIRLVGSGNIGATNIFRSLGRKLGVVVGFLDICKGFIPAFLARHYYTQDWQVILLSILPVIGHIFPIWLKFKGGKGVATIFGVLGAFFGLAYFLIFLLIWYFVVKQVKLMSLVNLVVGLLLPLAFWIKFRALSLTVFGLTLCVIIWWTHRKNIQRLLAGNENRIDL